MLGLTPVGGDHEVDGHALAVLESCTSSALLRPVDRFDARGRVDRDALASRTQRWIIAPAPWLIIRGTIRSPISTTVSVTPR